MSIEFIYPEFEVIRNDQRCIACRVCERQCANDVHQYDPERGLMASDETRCVDCQRCVSLCPTRALKIVKNDCALRENANWQTDTVKEIYKQAGSGRLSSFLPWETETAACVLGQDSYQRLSGDKSAH